MAEKKAGRKAAKAADPAARPAKGGGEAAVLAKIAAMPESFLGMGERLHALILRSAPALQPALGYAMPARAERKTWRR